jgi:hypothetical protein
MSPNLPNLHCGAVDIGTSQRAAGRGGETCLRKSPKDTASRFWVFPAGELALGRAKRAAFGKKVPMTSGNSTKDIPFGGSEVEGRDKLTEHREPKWKFRAKKS